METRVECLGIGKNGSARLGPWSMSFPLPAGLGIPLSCCFSGRRSGGFGIGSEGEETSRFYRGFGFPIADSVTLLHFFRFFPFLEKMVYGHSDLRREIRVPPGMGRIEYP